MTFVKHDAGKPRFDLLDPFFVEGIVAVLTHGAKKYADNNWQKGSRARYIAALGRHWNSYLKGEDIDTDSGMPVLWHIACCLMFLDWMDRQRGEIELSEDRLAEMQRPIIEEPSADSKQGPQMMPYRPLPHASF